MWKWLLVVMIAASGAYADNVKPLKIAEGTGFYISHDGYILTANHVVAHCNGDISAHNEQMVVKVKLINSSPDYDLALLKIVPKLTIENIAHIRTLRYPPQPGEKVAIAGYPDDATDLSHEFVSFSTNDAKITKAKGPNGEDKWMLFSYSARPGFSGGPVLDFYGNIIGLTSGGTCFSAGCSARFRQALNAVKNARTPEELRAADREVGASSDTNIAASATAIHLFLAKNNINMEEGDSLQAPSEKTLRGIAESIVNIRCFQDDEDFNQSIRVLDIR